MGETVRYATGMQRLFAFLVDFIVTLPIGFAVNYFIPHLPWYKLVLLCTMMCWVYYVLMDWKFGATVGKMVLRIRVQRDGDAKNLTLLQAVLRETVCKLISVIPLNMGYISVTRTPKKQAWHDMMVKSVVVKTVSQKEVI